MVKLLLDITRTLSRLDRDFATGIDRYEIAAIQDAFGRFDDPLFVSRFRCKPLYFDRTGLSALLAHKKNVDWPPARLFEAVRLKNSPLRRRINSAIRSAALQPEENLETYDYVNLAHSEPPAGLTEQVNTTGYYIHDVIPLDYPEYSTPASRAKSQRFLPMVAAQADHIWYPSAASQDRFVAHFKRRDNHHVIYPASDAAFREGQAQRDPIFVALGTIEPRKNLEFLLEIWPAVLARKPDAQLHIVGQLGWMSDGFIERLKGSALFQSSVFWIEHARDADVAELLARASALLMPSHAEGYGLPILEALCAQTPVLANALTIYDELFGDAITQIPVADPETWIDAIVEGALAKPKPPKQQSKTWQEFFDSLYSTIVLR